MDPVRQRQTDDLKKNAARMNAEDVKRARAFEAMCNTEGWKMYMELLNSHINDRASKLFQPTANSLESLAVEHNKGALFGLIQARDLPSVSIAAMKELRAAATEPEASDPVEENPDVKKAP